MRSKNTLGLSKPFASVTYVCMMVLLIGQVSYAQIDNLNIVAFPTYEDYMNMEGKEVGTLTGFKSNYWDKYTLKLASGKKYDLNGIWGFKVGDHLFRVIGVGTPIFVHTKGLFVYYEHGEFHLQYLIKGEWAYNYESTFRYFSYDLAGYVESSEKEFARQNPDFKPAMDCYHAKGKSKDYKTDIDNFRECFQLLTAE